MGINTEDNMETELFEQYSVADSSAATQENVTAMEPDIVENTAAISPRKDKRTWNETLELLKTTYTISMRDICQQLKSSRSWVAKYIIPYLGKLYLDTGYRGDRMTTKSWTRTAAIMLNDNKYLNNSVWCNEEQFDRLIRMHAVSITKQTKRIPVELLVKDKQQFAKEYNPVEEQIRNNEANLRRYGYNKDIMKEIEGGKKLLEMIFEDHVSDEGRTVLDAGMTNITKRNEIIPVSVAMPETPIAEWRALHDDKDYGDTDESILRQYFKEGYVRVEIQIPDPKELSDPATIFDLEKSSNNGANKATIFASSHVNSADEVANMTINSSDSCQHITAIISDIINGSQKENDKETIQKPINESQRQQKCSKKVYYIADPDPIRHQYVDRYITISEKVWCLWERKGSKKEL